MKINQIDKRPDLSRMRMAGKLKADIMRGSFLQRGRLMRQKQKGFILITSLLKLFANRRPQPDDGCTNHQRQRYLCFHQRGHLLSKTCSLRRTRMPNRVI